MQQNVEAGSDGLFGPTLMCKTGANITFKF
jgi:hypothetical protein